MTLMQASLIVGRNLDPRLTPEQKAGIAQILRLELGEDKMIDEIAAHPFSQLKVSAADWQGMSAYLTAQDEFYDLVHSRELFRDCIEPLLPELPAFATECPDQSGALLDLLRMDTQKRVSRVRSEMALSKGTCDDRLERAHGAILEDPTLRGPARDLLRKARIAVVPTPGKNGIAWNAAGLQALLQAVQSYPDGFAKRLPFTSVMNFKTIDAGLLGWYWSTARVFVFFGGVGPGPVDPDKIHTLTHELAHAWDYANLRKNADRIADWRKTGDYAQYRYRVSPELAPAADAFWMSEGSEWPSVYSRYSPAEDFAETAYFSIHRGSEAQKRLPKRYGFFQRVVAK
jgi:hypothetical protein